MRRQPITKEMSIAKDIENRRNGSINKWSFYLQISRKRIRELAISKFQDVDVIQLNASINDIDVELEEYRYMLVSGHDGSICIYDVQNFAGVPKHTSKLVSKIGRSHPDIHSQSVEKVQWYPHDNGIFLTCSTDGFVKVWDTNALRAAEAFNLKGRLHCLHMSSVATQHHLIAVAKNPGECRLIDLKTGASTHELRGHQGDINVVRWSTGEEFALATGDSNKLRLWDVRQSKSCLRYFDYNRTRERVKSRKKIELAGRSHDSIVNGIRFLANGKWIVSMGRDGKVRMWDTFFGYNLKVPFPKVYNKTYATVNFDVCDDSSTIFVPNQSALVSLDASTGSSRTLSGHYSKCVCCFYNPGLQEVYSGGSDRNVIVWDCNKLQSEAYEEELKSQIAERTDGKSTRRVQLSVVTNDAWSSSSSEEE